MAEKSHVFPNQSGGDPPKSQNSFIRPHDMLFDFANCSHNMSAEALGSFRISSRNDVPLVGNNNLVTPSNMQGVCRENDFASFGKKSLAKSVGSLDAAFGNDVRVVGDNNFVTTPSKVQDRKFYYFDCLLDKRLNYNHDFPELCNLNLLSVKKAKPVAFSAQPDARVDEALVEEQKVNELFLYST